MEILAAEEPEKATWPCPDRVVSTNNDKFTKQAGDMNTSNPPLPSGIGVRRSDGESMIMWSLKGEEETSPSSLECSLGMLINIFHGRSGLRTAFKTSQCRASCGKKGPGAPD
eukprot:762186-Hanusia_phi.AAC.5